MSKILFVCAFLLLTVACHREEVIVIEEPQSYPQPQPNPPHAYPQPDPYYPPNETSGKDYFEEGNNYPDQSADDWLNNSGQVNETSGAEYFHEKNSHPNHSHPNHSQPNYSQPSHTDYHEPKKNETADDWLDNSGQVNETSGANYFDEKPKNNYNQPKDNYSKPKDNYNQPKDNYSKPKDTSADAWLDDTGQVDETSGADFFGEDY